MTADLPRFTKDSEANLGLKPVQLSFHSYIFPSLPHPFSRSGMVLRVPDLPSLLVTIDLIIGHSQAK